MKWVANFFLIAIAAGPFGSGGIAAGAAAVARVLFFMFLIVFLVTLIMGIRRK